jgi:N-acetylglucosaminyl-diphospho-decaprenol L-rhamnosyltransferase
MDLSIIIPSFNTKDLLDRCLESIYRTLKKTSLSFEVIVIDNNSSDGSVELLNKKYEQVIKVFNKENVGYGKANNIGIKRAIGTQILLLNSDCVVLDDAIDKLYRFSLSHPKSFIGGKLFNEDTSPQTSCGPFYTLPIVFVMLFLKGDTFHITRSSPSSIKQVDWVSGACIMAPKSLFESVGGFDEGIFMYMEEIDLLYRAKEKGYTTLFYPEAHIIHSGAASSKNKKEPVVNIYRGLVYFYNEHYPKWQIKVLKFFLSLKARIVICIGTILGKKETVRLYEKALVSFR